MEASKAPIKEDLIGDVFDVEEALKVISNNLSDARPPDSVSAQWTIRLNARDAIDKLVEQVASIKAEIEAIDF